MSVRVSHNLGALEADWGSSAKGFVRPVSRAVRSTNRTGWRTARRISRRKAGLHGGNAYKRITEEVLGAFEAEYGYEGTEFVGINATGGGPNLDIAQSSDGLADELERRVSAALRSSWSVT